MPCKRSTSLDGCMRGSGTVPEGSADTGSTSLGGEVVAMPMAPSRCSVRASHPGTQQMLRKGERPTPSEKSAT